MRTRRRFGMMLLSLFSLLLTPARPCGAQTLWTSPHGPGMRGLSPARVSAQPALKWKLLLPQGIGHAGVTFGEGGKYLYFKTYGPEQSRAYKVDAATGKVVWISPVQFGMRNLSGITVDDASGRVFTAGNWSSLSDEEAFAACLDRATGQLIWQTRLTMFRGYSIVLRINDSVGDGYIMLSPNRSRLYIHNGRGKVTALDAKDGKRLWIEAIPPHDVHEGSTAETLGPVWTDPGTGRTQLVVCPDSGPASIICLQDDGESASVVWKTSLTEAGDPKEHGLDRLWGHAASSTDGKKLYLNGMDTGNPVLVCLDSSDGKTLWRIDRSAVAPMSFYPPPCVGPDGTVYAAGTLDGKKEIGGIVAVTPEGQIRWTLDTHGGEVNGWPAVTSAKVLYAVDQSRGKKPHLIAVKDHGPKGDLLWRVQLPDNANGYSSPVPGPDGTVYVAAVSERDGPVYLYAFAPNGTVVSERLASRVAPEAPKPPLVPLKYDRITARKPAPPLAVPEVSPVLMPQLAPPHVSSVVTFSPDSLYMATGGLDLIARLWNVATGKEVRRFEGHTGSIYSVAFSPDGRYLATGSDDKTARLWEVATKKEVRRFTLHPRSVTSVAFSSDSRHLATGCRDGIARVWDVANGKELRRFEGHSGSVKSVTFSPDGRYLATRSADETARLWDVSTGKELRRFRGHSAAFSPDCRYLATGSTDGTDRLWDIATQKEVRRFAGYAVDAYPVAFSPESRYLATSSIDGTIRLLDVATGKEVRRFKGHEIIHCVAFSPDGRYMATSSIVRAQLWDLATGKERRRFEGNIEAIDSVGISFDGRYLATGSNDGATRLWDVTIGEEVRRFAGQSGRVNSVAFSPDGRYLATSNNDWTIVLNDWTIRLWEVANGKEVRRFEGHSRRVNSIAFSPDCRYLATSSDDSTAWLWDVSTGKGIRRIGDHGSPVNYVAFSPDGTYVATGNDIMAQLWNVETGREVRRFDRHHSIVGIIAFSPDSRYLATGSDDGTIRQWDVATGKEVRSFKCPSRIASIAFSPDNRCLAASRLSDLVQLWDVLTGKEISRLHKHGIHDVFLTFSPDGSYLAIGSEDGTCEIVDVEKQRSLCHLMSFKDGSWAVVDPEGRYDASGDDIEGLVWVVGNEPIALSQLKDRYYEPGLLAKLMGHNTEALRDVTPFRNVGLPPLVEVLPPQKGETRVTVRVTARSGGIGRVEVQVNGSEYLADARGANRTARKVANLSVDMKGAATLKPWAANTISVVAYTATEPLIATLPKSVEWKAPGSIYTGKHRLYAVVAGVSDYAGEDIDLNCAGKDAVDIYTTLKMAADNLYGEGQVDIRLFTTDQHPKAQRPTKAAIRKAFADFRKSRTDDTLVVYLAGHGVTLPQGQDTYCYLTQEARSLSGVTRDPKVRQQQSITSDELREWIKVIPALKRAVILDTCGAAGAGEDLLARDVPGDQKRAAALLSGKVGIQVLMGCAADAKSYENVNYGQGLLTYAILDGIRGAALEDDRIVDVVTLFRHVPGIVERIVREGGEKQKPEVWSRGDTFAIGSLRPEDKAKVPIGVERPVVVRPVFQNQEVLDDSQRLADRVIERLLAREWEGTRGGSGRTGGAKGPGIAYRNVGDMPGALRPRASYTVEGQTITVRLAVWRDKTKLLQTDFTGTTDRLDDLVDKIVETIIGAWTPSPAPAPPAASPLRSPAHPARRGLAHPMEKVGLAAVCWEPLSGGAGLKKTSAAVPSTCGSWAAATTRSPFGSTSRVTESRPRRSGHPLYHSPRPGRGNRHGMTDPPSAPTFDTAQSGCAGVLCGPVVLRDTKPGIFRRDRSRLEWISLLRRFQPDAGPYPIRIHTRTSANRPDNFRSGRRSPSCSPPGGPEKT